MLLRICLIVAILGGAAAATCNFLLVQKEITQTISERDTEKQAKETAQNDLAKTKKDLAATKTTLDRTKKDLAQTKSDLDSANDKVSDLEKKNSDLADRLTKTQEERDHDDQELSKWAQLNITPQGVTKLRDDMVKMTAARDAVVGENKLLASKLSVVQDELAQIVGTNNTVPLEPPGLMGKVVAVDPRYGFIVVDMGENQLLVPRGIMMVARGGKLVGKVQISHVDKTQSIGTVMSNWTPGEIMEGDVVLD